MLMIENQYSSRYYRLRKANKNRAIHLWRMCATLGTWQITHLKGERRGAMGEPSLICPNTLLVPLNSSLHVSNLFLGGSNDSLTSFLLRNVSSSSSNAGFRFFRSCRRKYITFSVLWLNLLGKEEWRINRAWDQERWRYKSDFDQFEVEFRRRRRCEIFFNFLTVDSGALERVFLYPWSNQASKLNWVYQYQQQIP